MKKAERKKFYFILGGKTPVVRDLYLSLHLNNPKLIEMVFLVASEFLSSLLLGTHLVCFVLARLNPLILFVQAIHQMCQAGNS